MMKVVFRKVIVCIMLIALLTGCVKNNKDAINIQFEDYELKTQILKVLNDDTDNLTKKTIENLETLIIMGTYAGSDLEKVRDNYADDLTVGKIVSLNGLEQAKNLKNIIINSNNLAGEIDVSIFENAEKIDLSFNQISNVSGLDKVDKLLVLSLDGNEIDEIVLSSENEVLERIELKYNNIENIDFLAKLSNLKYINLDNNKITDISILLELKNLESVSLSGNPIENTQVIKLLKKKEVFVVFNNENFEEQEL